MSHDNLLQAAVLAELAWDPSVVAAHIGVTAADGVVTLTGHVESYAQKLSAETAARRVKGVKAIAEELEVRLPYSVKRDDADIARATVDRLAWNGTVPKDSVAVRVEKGWVTLTGEVAWHFQKDSAAQEVRSLTGVVGVINLITIKARADAGKIDSNIEQALHRSWFDPKTIKVSVDGGKINLGGTVKSWSERDIAEDTAWAAPGVTEVDNNILVD
jgi:osmotically-inducible protein OsmY